MYFQHITQNKQQSLHGFRIGVTIKQDNFRRFTRMQFFENTLLYHGFFLDTNGSILYKLEALHPAGGWSNGKTADSDSAYRGSNPCPPATS